MKNGISVNNNPFLEKEADVIGAKSISKQEQQASFPLQLKQTGDGSQVIQLMELKRKHSLNEVISRGEKSITKNEIKNGNNQKFTRAILRQIKRAKYYNEIYENVLSEKK